MNTTAILEQANKARECGFVKLADQLAEKADRASRLAQAYEHYRYVSLDAINEFKMKLYKTTKRAPTRDDHKVVQDLYVKMMYHRTITEIANSLVMQPISEYQSLPPSDVLDKIKIAQDRKIFDSFQVASVDVIATKMRDPDPIVFGMINGCTDHFFIAEWGDDVSIGDLIGKHDG